MARYIAVEFHVPDNRPLLRNGTFGVGNFAGHDVATFDTEEAARTAAAQASNKREGGTIDTVRTGA